MGVNGNLVYTTIAPTDRLGADLRRLGGLLHYRTAKDREGALAVMAVRPPGSSVLLGWLEQQANSRGRDIYQHGMRARKGKGKGKGKGRGDGQDVTG